MARLAVVEIDSTGFCTVTEERTKVAQRGTIKDVEEWVKQWSGPVPGVQRGDLDLISDHPTCKIWLGRERERFLERVPARKASLVRDRKKATPELLWPAAWVLLERINKRHDYSALMIEVGQTSNGEPLVRGWPWGHTKQLGGRICWGQATVSGELTPTDVYSRFLGTGFAVNHWEEWPLPKNQTMMDEQIEAARQVVKAAQAAGQEPGGCLTLHNSITTRNY